MEYKFSGKLSFDDYVQMNRFHLREVLSKIKYIFISFCLIYIGYLVYTYLKYNYLDIFSDIIPIFIFILLWFFLVYYRPKIFFKKHYESNKISIEEKTFTINENTILIESENDVTKITKDNIYDIKMDKNSIYIFMGTAVVFVIKDKYLQSKNEFDELKNFVIKNYAKH